MHRSLLNGYPPQDGPSPRADRLGFNEFLVVVRDAVGRSHVVSIPFRVHDEPLIGRA